MPGLATTTLTLKTTTKNLIIKIQFLFFCVSMMIDEMLLPVNDRIIERFSMIIIYYVRVKGEHL